MLVLSRVEQAAAVLTQLSGVRITSKELLPRSRTAYVSDGKLHKLCLGLYVLTCIL